HRHRLQASAEPAGDPGFELEQGQNLAQAPRRNAGTVHREQVALAERQEHAGKLIKTLLEEFVASTGCGHIGERRASTIIVKAPECASQPSTSAPTRCT